MTVHRPVPKVLRDIFNAAKEGKELSICIANGQQEEIEITVVNINKKDKVF